MAAKAKQMAVALTLINRMQRRSSIAGVRFRQRVISTVEDDCDRVAVWRTLLFSSPSNSAPTASRTSCSLRAHAAWCRPNAGDECCSSQVPDSSIGSLIGIVLMIVVSASVSRTCKKNEFTAFESDSIPVSTTCDMTLLSCYPVQNNVDGLHYEWVKRHLIDECSNLPQVGSRCTRGTNQIT